MLINARFRANSYKVYQGNEPGGMTNLIGQDIVPTTYTHTDGALNSAGFYMVRASTDIGRNMNDRERVYNLSVKSKRPKGNAISIPINSAE